MLVYFCVSWLEELDLGQLTYNWVPIHGKACSGKKNFVHSDLNLFMLVQTH